jgi:hypothetical protein
VNNFNDKCDVLLEQLNVRSFKTTNRVFYPRKLTLSEDFINLFKKEHKRLMEEHKMKPTTALQQIAKALLFHSRF